MNETKKLIETLKRCLRSRGVTYRALAKALGLSESSVKRVFAEESFTLARLERVCTVLEMTVTDLVQMNSGSRETHPHTLTFEQERVLANNPSLLACFYLLLNGRSEGEVQRRLGLSLAAFRGLLTNLANAGLLERQGKQKIRLHARLPIAWRPNGPVRRLYERQVRAEFLQHPFEGPQESLTFHSAELSAASLRILQRKIDRLAADFAELAALDMRVPAREKTSTALLLACRPWVFSMFSAYRVQRAAVKATMPTLAGQMFR